MPLLASLTSGDAAHSSALETLNARLLSRQRQVLGAGVGGHSLWKTEIPEAKIAIFSVLVAPGGALDSCIEGRVWWLCQVRLPTLLPCHFSTSMTGSSMQATCPMDQAMEPLRPRNLSIWVANSATLRRNHSISMAACSISSFIL